MNSLIEEELAKDNVLNLVTGLLAWASDGQIHDFDPDKGLAWWNSCVEELRTNPLWANGKHCGDCTKHPHTCFRCWIEEEVKSAKELIVKQTKTKKE